MLILFANADSSIIDFKLDSIHHCQLNIFGCDTEFCLPNAHLDVPIEGELCRVPQQIDQNLFDSLVVTVNYFWHIMSHRFDQEHRLFDPQLDVDQLTHFLCQLFDVHLLVIHFELA